MNEATIGRLDAALKETIENAIDGDYLSHVADVLARGDLQLEAAATKDAKVQELWQELLKDPAFFLKNEMLYLNSMYQNRSIEKQLPDGKTRIDFATREPSRTHLAEIYSITLVDEGEGGAMPSLFECSRMSRLYGDVPTLVTIRIDGDDVHVLVDAYERGSRFVHEEADPDTVNALLKEMILESMTAAGKVARRDAAARTQSDTDTLAMLRAQRGVEYPTLHHLKSAA